MVSPLKNESRFLITTSKSCWSTYPRKSKDCHIRVGKQIITQNHQSNTLQWWQMIDLKQHLHYACNDDAKCWGQTNCTAWTVVLLQNRIGRYGIRNSWNDVDRHSRRCASTMGQVLPLDAKLNRRNSAKNDWERVDEATDWFPVLISERKSDKRQCLYRRCLCVFELGSSPNCLSCDSIPEQPGYVFFHCPRFRKESNSLKEPLEGTATLERLTSQERQNAVN